MITITSGIYSIYNQNDNYMMKDESQQKINDSFVAKFV